jgi:hypothetical protein
MTLSIGERREQLDSLEAIAASIEVEIREAVGRDDAFYRNIRWPEGLIE